LKSLQPKEQAIQAQILAYLKFKGYFVWRNNSGATRAGKFGERFIRYGLVGSADILGLTKQGMFLAIEVKRPGGRLSPHQEAFLDAIRANKGMAIVAYSLTDVQKIL
jgi:hypothetical protein